MTRDLAAELDALRAEVSNLAQAVRELQQPAGTPAPGTAPRQRFALANELQKQVEGGAATGLVTYAGYYKSSDRVAKWEMVGRRAETLLAQDDEKVARALAALAHRQRLALLKEILKQPASAAELVERLGMGTTGQVYHHLKALVAADLVVQEERGQFAFRGHRVQSLLMLLAGVSDLLDTTYSTGTWEEEPKE